jgi:hypothetical protein
VSDATGAKPDSDGEETRVWDSRLGWAYGLIADDPLDRAVAHMRHTHAGERVGKALKHFNETFDLNRPNGRIETWVPPLAEAYEAYREAMRHVLPDALWNRPPGALSDWPGLPYAMLYLEWEARYPQEWTAHAKKWGSKALLIRNLADADLPAAARAKLGELIELAVRRAYRCKDREYVRVARAIDGPALRMRLEAAADADDPWARLHAGYVLRLLDRPDLPNTRRTWELWCAGTGPDTAEPAR